ncbi:MAG: universal stress protein, partial [Gammaproteobacteria bacterium]|nr:universal stress protein [Gammaproteobacteria bacterium]
TVLKKAERLLVAGLPVTRILEVAKRLEPKMLVMGSAGRTGLSHFLLGSKAEQLLRLCPYPVTIVKLPENQE